MTDLRAAYRSAGVDVAAGDRATALLRERLGPVIGGFGSVTPLPSGYREPLLVSATDGVGTKTAIASALRRYDTIGVDLVGMCADDVVCHGARPLFFLDYLAVGRVDPVDVAALVGGVARACEHAGCELVGGETAEHPGVMDPVAFDLAGFCVGIVERSELLDGSQAQAGDVLLGIASSGLHANGYSLVRAMLARYELELERPYVEVVRRVLPDAEAEATERAEPEHVFTTLGEVLLAPTRIYAPDVLALRAALDESGTPLHGLAHVTGGGLPGNIPRALPDQLGARIDPARWTMPSIFRVVAALAGIAGPELRATLNAGIGMVAVVPEAGVERALALLAAAGHAAWSIGEVVTREGLSGARYAEVGA